MDRFDLTQKSAYNDYLADVNKVNKVETTCDVYNESGALVIGKGVAVDERVTEMIAKHKLAKPMADSIALKDSINANGLYKHLHQFLDACPDLRHMHQVLELDKKVQSACSYFGSFPLLVQKITVMSIKFPELFRSSVLGAWLSMVIAEHHKDNKLPTKFAFIAGLVRDIGFLHLNPEVQQKNSVLVTDWDVYKSHVAIAKVILQHIESTPKSVTIAVAQHHERCDGTGFPSGKVGKALLLLGQIVAMADEIIDLRLGYLEETNQSIGNINPYLDLHMGTHFESVYRAIKLILKETMQSFDRCVINAEFPFYLKNLIKINDEYTKLWIQLQSLPNNLDSESELNEEKVAIAIFAKIRYFIAMSGLLSEEFTRWMQHVYDNELVAAYEEMESIGIMFIEFDKYFYKLAKYLKLLVKQNQVKYAALEPHIEAINSAAFKVDKAFSMNHKLLVELATDSALAKQPLSAPN